MKTTVRLTESAVMLALSAVLSLLPIAQLPYGGSITACSALPLVVIAFRHGVGRGVFAGAVFGLLQMLLGMKNVMYFTSPAAMIAVVALDYLLAFAAVGAAGAFRKHKHQTASILAGALLYSVIRYALHVLAGATVWAGLSIPTEAALTYSLIYNLTYMLPETVVLLLGTALVSRLLNLRDASMTRTGGRARPDALTAVAWAIGTAALVAVVALVFSPLQSADTGEFSIAGLTQVDWLAVGVIMATGTLIAAVLMLVRRARRG